MTKKLSIITYPKKAPEKLNWYDVNFSHHNDIFDGLVSSGAIHKIVEVGTFVGFTACHLARKNEIEKVFAVDNWSMNLRGCMFPQKQFISNVIRSNLQDKIIPIKGDSSDVGIIFQKLGIKTDLIYIDARHDYLSVLKDIKAWYPVGSMICGDDYDKPTVKKAIDKLSTIYNRIVRYEDNFWWYE